MDRAWNELLRPGFSESLTIKFLSEEYKVDIKERKIYSLSSKGLAKEFISVLILHFVLRKLEGLPQLTGQWVSFKELSGIEGYYPAFRKRSIEPIIRKYGDNPEGLASVLRKFPGRIAEQGDTGIILEPFELVPLMIILWHKDEEFGAEANILFDKSINGIFCIEDIVVLCGIVALSL